ncbi:hypothetical protein AMJ57_04270 [Parcubacteria bacterium SG8_24]|nr:MAG: hypothetical protein AMJ57_04270 [Parcubacteria bacterium SG8_24]
MRPKAFTLVEILVTIGIIGLLAVISVVALGPSLKKARDTKRKTELARIGRFMAGTTCYLPEAGAGDYDLEELMDDVRSRYQQYAKMLPARTPRDPKSGSATVSGYRYVVTAAGADCALYANLEKADEEVTLTVLTAPTPGGGTGVLQAASPGPNGTDRYFQVSNK